MMKNGDPMQTQKAAALARALRDIIAVARKAIEENKLPARPTRGERFTLEERVKIVKLHAKGMSASKIARQIGRTQAGVSKYLRRRKNKVKDTPGWTPEGGWP
jgi:DNA-binding NarL/FixJ family response regulator